MANSTTGSVWKLDTAGVIDTNPFYCYRMVWTPTADGDDIDVQDNGANSIWSYNINGYRA